MSFARFVLSSLGLSVSVALRMAVVSAVVIYAFYLGFHFLFSLPLPEHNLILVAVLVAIILFVPTLLFLYLSSIRAGLVALEASGPPNIGTLATALFRMMRFNLMFISFFVVLFGAGVSLAYLLAFDAQFIDRFREGLDIKTREGLFSLLGILRDTPLVLASFFALGFCLLNGANGVSMAVTAASAAVRSPGQDVLWGLGRRFGYLFGTTAIFLLAPVIVGTLLLGGLRATAGDVADLPLSVLGGIAGYLLWCACLLSAAKAKAYALTVADVEREHKAMMAELAANIPEEEKPDLASILHERMKAARQVRKSAPATGLPARSAAAPPDDEDGSVVPLRKRIGARDTDQRGGGNAEHGAADGPRVVPFRALTETGSDEDAGEADADRTGAGEDWFEKLIESGDSENPSSR